MEQTNRYQVKEVAAIANISPRTLHYYDQIGLLSPSVVGDNGYRYYDQNALVRLQQILLYKSFGMQLGEISQLLEKPEFNTLRALQQHKDRLLREIERIETMLNTIDNTIEFLRGERNMAKEDFFKGYDPNRQAEYEEEIRQKYGDKELKQSQQRWGSYSAEKRAQIQAEGGAITQALLDNMAKGFDHPDVQKEVAHWHQFISYFYDCSLEVFEGLGRMYNEDPRFHSVYANADTEFPEFMMHAMKFYADEHRKK